jgi:hypothetical protein
MLLLLLLLLLLLCLQNGRVQVDAPYTSVTVPGRKLSNVEATVEVEVRLDTVMFTTYWVCSSTSCGFSMLGVFCCDPVATTSGSQCQPAHVLHSQTAGSRHSACTACVQRSMQS